MGLRRVHIENLEIWEGSLLSGEDYDQVERLAQDDKPEGLHRLIVSATLLNRLLKSDTQTLWLIGNVPDDSVPEKWEFQGLFDTEEEAAALAVAHPNWFIVPVEVNESKPDEHSTWEGAYSPYLKSQGKECEYV